MRAQADKGNFATGKVWRRILSQALPLTLAEIVQVTYTIVDRIYLGHLSEQDSMALIGIGVAFPIIALIAAFTSLFGQGGAPLFAIARGADRDDRAVRLQGCTFTLLLTSGCALTVLFLLLRRPMLMLFGASEASYPYADVYMQVYLLGTPFTMIATGMNGFINAQGYPRIGMGTTILGAAINLVLDPLFLFVFGWGIRGVAVATVISQVVSCLWVMRFLTGKQAQLPLKRKDMRVEGCLLKDIVSLGIVGFIMKATNSLVQITANSMLRNYGGDLYVGAMTVVNSVREILALPVTGVTSGASPVLGYNYGAKKYERVRAGIRFTTVTAVSYTLLAWVLVLWQAPALTRLFTADAALHAITPHALRLYFFGFFFQAFQVSAQSTFQAIGDAKHAIFFSLLRKVVIVTPLTFLLPAMGLGVDGVFWAEPVSNALGGMAAFLTMMTVIYNRKLRESDRA